MRFKYLKLVALIATQRVRAGIDWSDDMLTLTMQGAVANLRKLVVALGLAVITGLMLGAAPVAAQVADLVVNQSDTPDPGPAGGVFTYTLRVDNNGPNASIGITLTDTLPPGAVFVGVNTTQGTCSAPVAGVMSCSLGDLAFLGQATVTLQVILPTPGVFTNTASATATTPDPNTANNLNISEDTTAQNASDMTLTVVDSPDPVAAGGAYSYAVTVINNGPANAASQTIAFSIPAGACVTALPSGSGWSCAPAGSYPRCTAGQTITCTRSTNLPAGASAPVLNVPAVANVGGSITAAFQVSSPLQDGNPSDNTVTATTTVLGGYSDVSITKAASPTVVAVGSNVTYTLTPRFNGGEPPGTLAPGIITVTDTLGAGLNYVSHSAGAGWTCNFVAPTLTCTRPGPFTPNFTNMPTISIVATVTSAATINNTANISAPEIDPVPANNNASINITGSNDADLTMTKLVSQTPVVPGFPYTYTLRVRNAGPVGAAIGQTVTVTDTLPAGVSLRSTGVSGTGWSCSSVPVTPPFPAFGPVTITCTRTLTAVQAPNTNFPDITVRAETTTAGILTNNACVALSGAGPADAVSSNNCRSVNVTSTDSSVSADLRVDSKTASPGSLSAGQDLTYVINVSNAGPGNATSVVVTDTLNSLVGAGGFQSAVPTQGTCTPGGVTAGPNVTLTCNLGTLNVGASASITVVIRPSVATTGTRTNTATITSLDVGDPNRENNSGAVAGGTIVNAIVDVTVSKSATPNPVQAGTPLTYIVSAINAGPSTASTVVATDTLPANAVFVSFTGVTGAGASCVVPSAGTLGGTVTCTWPSIVSGAQQTATFIVRPVTGATSVQNNVVITTATPETNSANNSFSITTPVTNATVDILVNKVDSVDPVALGGLTTYTITTTNAGPSYATNVTMVDTFPLGGVGTATFSYQGNLTISPPGIGTCVEPALNVTSGVLTCTFPGVANGQVAIVTYDMRAETIASGVSGTAFNTATVSAAETETLPANNMAINATTSRRVADLAVVKSAPTTITPGTAFDWTITVTNNGPNVSVGAIISDTLPAGVTFQSASAGCVFSAGVVTCTLATLNAGASTALAITVLPSAPYTGTNPLLNTATVSTVNEVDNVPGNNSSSASSGLAVTDLQVVKTVSNPTPGTGTSVVFMLVASNNGPNNAVGVQVVDQLPAGYTYVSSTVTQGSYVAGTGLWTIGNLANGASATLNITATVNASGPYANTGVISSPDIDPVPGNNTSTVTPVPLLAPSLMKSIAPATIGLGGSATLTIGLGNPNAIGISLTAPFTDTMPAGVTLTSSNTGTCAGVTTTGTTITMASGSVIPVGGCSIVVTITSSTPGSVLNTTSALLTTGGTAPPASAPLTVTATASTLGKTIVPATIPIGGTATLTISLANANAVALILTAPFVDSMPAGVTVTSLNSGTCTGVTVTTPALTMAAGSSIPAGGCTIIVSVTSSTAGSVTNVTSTLETQLGITPAASAPLTVIGNVATLTKTIAPATIGAGGTATLTLNLGNANSLPITLTAAFVDTMPAGVTTTSGNSGTCTGVTVTSTTVTMASGASIPVGGCTIIVTVTSITPGTVINTTSALQTNAGTTPAASAPLTVTTVNALTKSITPSTIAPGGTATLTLTLGNTTPSPLTLTAPFTDSMPAGVTITSGNTGTCTGVTVTTTSITKASGSMIPPGGCTIVVTITSATPGTVVNTTSALQTVAGTTPPASAPLTVVAGAITLSKAFTPAEVVVGSSATLVLILGNPGIAPVTLTAPFTDPMPPGLTITSPNTGTCTGVTVTPTVITMATGSSIPPGGCTIVVGVEVSAVGSFVNVTSPLATSGGSAPPATAPIAAKASPYVVEPIPVNGPFALALLLLMLGVAGGMQLRRRRM